MEDEPSKGIQVRIFYRGIEEGIVQCEFPANQIVTTKMLCEDLEDRDYGKGTLISDENHLLHDNVVLKPSKIYCYLLSDAVEEAEWNAKQFTPSAFGTGGSAWRALVTELGDDCLYFRPNGGTPLVLLHSAFREFCYHLQHPNLKPSPLHIQLAVDIAKALLQVWSGHEGRLTEQLAAILRKHFKTHGCTVECQPREQPSTIGVKYRGVIIWYIAVKADAGGCTTGQAITHVLQDQTNIRNDFPRLYHNTYCPRFVSEVSATLMRFSGTATERQVLFEPLAVADCVLREQQLLYLSRILTALQLGLKDIQATIDAHAPAPGHRCLFERPAHLRCPPYFRENFPNAARVRPFPIPPQARFHFPPPPQDSAGGVRNDFIQRMFAMTSATSKSAIQPASGLIATEGLQSCAATAEDLYERPIKPAPRMYLVEEAGKEIIVKFFQSSTDEPKQVYEAASNAGIGPKVTKCEQLPRTSWWVVHMEYLKQHRMVSDWANELSSQDFTVLTEAVKKRVKDFQDMRVAGMKVVHGDLRLDNIGAEEVIEEGASGHSEGISMRKFNVRIWDYDWSGFEGSATYPLMMNTAVKWHDDVWPGAVLQQEHDLHLVTSELKAKLKEIKLHEALQP